MTTLVFGEKESWKLLLDAVKSNIVWYSIKWHQCDCQYCTEDEDDSVICWWCSYELISRNELHQMPNSHDDIEKHLESKYKYKCPKCKKCISEEEKRISTSRICNEYWITENLFKSFNN